jgi:tripartite-type tricarboxylate transporter receptor subunit TctC
MALCRSYSFAMVGIAAALLGSGAATRAQDWPAKPVKIVVAFSPGGSADQLGRLIAPLLSSAFKQQFYVENRPGNSGSIGSALVARSEPDGYTLLIGGSGPHITGPAINPNIGYDPLKDFSHIGMIAGDTYVLAASPAVGAKSLADLVKVARGKALTASSPGAGSLAHLILERFKRSAGIDIQHVPAPNSGMTEVLGNHISMTLTTLLTAGEQIRSGKLVGLGVTSAVRNPAYTDIPTFAEQGFADVRGETWFWLAGPKNLPPAIVNRLNAEVRHLVQLPATRGYFDKLALLSMDMDAAAVARFVAEEYAFWAPLAKDIGLKVQ